MTPVLLQYISAMIAVAYVAKTRRNLGCPVPASYFPTNRSEPTCTSDRQCGPDQLCCDWFSSKHCLEGISTVDKPGTCPAQVMVPAGSAPCIDDFTGCQYDSQCSGAEKCCHNVNCDYSQCQAPTSENPICTELACGPAPGPECRRVVDFRPNGPGCAPVCRVCADADLTTATPSREDLACPSRLFPFNVPITNPCAVDADCAAAEKCCPWGQVKECREGVVTLPKEGACSTISTTDCIADFSGCDYDSQCPDSQKCCQHQLCGYKQCAVLPTRVP